MRPITKLKRLKLGIIDVVSKEKEIKDASTVVLLREVETEEKNIFEIFMTKRRKDLPFLGGFHVFPGGAMDAEDFDSESLERCIGVTEKEAQEILQDPDPKKNLGHFVTAIRELYEETGVLVAYDVSKKFPNFKDDKTKEKFKRHREMINDGKMMMKDMMEKEDLYYAVDELIYFYHRVAPKIAPVRFNARFFIVKIPEGQTPTPYENEIEKSEWLTPEQILTKSKARKMLMAPPTILSLRILAKSNSYADLLKRLK